MTNTEIKKHFNRLFLTFIPYLILAVHIWNEANKGGVGYDAAFGFTFGGFLFCAVVPFLWLLFARVYNLLAHGKWVVKEGQ